MPKLEFITWDAAGRAIWESSGRPVWDAAESPAGVPGRTAEITAVGLWEQVDDRTDTTQCWFEITERDGVYEGTIVKVFSAPGSISSSHTREGMDGTGVRFLGLTLITGMRRTGYFYDDGTIMDPRDGSRYRALMRLSSDGSKLEVRGYLGISLLGRSQIWNRLPDDALEAQATASP